MKALAVIGWYGHGNLGDESFKDSIRQIWPSRELAINFFDEIPPGINNYDAVMIGGGSFMDAAMPRLESIQVPFAYIGVGVGSSIHPDHKGALARAAAVVVRDARSAERLASEKVGGPVMVAADLFFGRDAFREWRGRDSDNIAVCLSEHFAPRGQVAEWVSASWSNFTRELAQVLDTLVFDGFDIVFIPMASAAHWDDRRAAAAVVSRMTRPDGAFWNWREEGEDTALGMMALSRVVVAQRFHGVVFAESMGCPSVPIMGHDKMIDLAAEIGIETAVPYHSASKDALGNAIRRAIMVGGRATTYRDGARARWRAVSESVREKLSL